MSSNRLLPVGVATAILLGSIALGAVPAGADDRPTLDDRTPVSFADGPNATAANASSADATVTAATVADATPAGYAPDRVDARVAVPRHHREVVASSSVHTTLTYEATANGGASVRGVEAWTNFSRGVQRATAQAVYTSAEQYVADGVRYTNTSVSYGDGPRYDRAAGDLRANRSTGRDVLARFLPYLEFSLRNVSPRNATTEGATVEDGARLVTYEATGFDADEFSIYTREVASVRSANATLVVDEQGRIRTFEFDLDATGDDGNPLTVEVSLSLDGFGTTDVERPAWVGEEFGRVNGTAA